MPIYIYLWGDMGPDETGEFFGKGNYWQDIVKKCVPADKDIRYLDPRLKRGGKGDKEKLLEFFRYDLLWVAKSTIIFGVITPKNPGGHMGALELGFGLGQAGLGKLAIIVNLDPPDSNIPLYQYRSCVNVAGLTYNNLEEGIKALKKAVAQFRETVSLKEACGE